MEKGLKINGEEIEFNKWSIGEITYPCITKSFKLKFDEIRLIALSPRLAMDDEILMITIIDTKGKFRQFSCYEFGKEPIKKFEKKLDLKSLREIEWEKFSWEEHENGITDKVIYPKKLYWEDLFVKPKNLKKIIIQILKFLLIKKSISGKFNPKIEKYLNNK
ncbi:hypothetical protein [Kordia sp.]|uniref:hypothetical protein n=1 Tax=Kordia sp. TaxID=1965332 RepID=UPI0025C56EF6|nr:hypothetical protein [Kordia sp.]MCH2193580.1 hypothetical protein [Kordia sp.]